MPQGAPCIYLDARRGPGCRLCRELDMKRLVLAAAVLVLTVASALAQRPPPGEGEDKSQALGSGIYSINWGTMGLNVGLSTGDDGILLVDAQDEPAVPRLQAEIAKRSDKPVRIVINS